MDVRFLATFLEVANTRHFGKAADNLFLTQSAVSARIKQLEEYFNTPLFTRHRNSIQLTAAGEKLVPFAQAMSQTLNDARQALKDSDIQHLVVAGTPNSWVLFLDRQLPELAESFAALSLGAEELSNEQLARQLHERTVDLAFSTQPVKSDEVVCTAIARWPMALCAKSPDVLNQTQLPFTQLDWGTGLSEALDKCTPANRHVVLKTASLRAALAASERHCSAVWLPLTEDDSGEWQQQLRPIKDAPDLYLTLYLMYLKDAPHRGLGEVIDFIASR